MTYSIIARDPETGEIGVAVQTAWIAVGTICSWAEAGVGAVATQSYARPSHGPSGLTLIRNGHTAKEALAAVLAGDPGREVRQVGMIDVNGVADSFTGANCIRFAGHHVGENYAVQANMMATDTVPDAMVAAFESTRGELVVRLLAALQAAQGEGGDFRGKQSAALKIVKGELPKNYWEGVVFDVRVDDHAEPVTELTRICNRHQAHDKMWAGLEKAAQGDFDAAMTLYEASIAIDNTDMQPSFSFAVDVAVKHRQLSLVEHILRDLFQRDRMWVEYFVRMAEARPNDYPADICQAALKLADA